jgi:hypothetical protein
MMDLTPSKGRIFRIVHARNVPWILEHDGMYCKNSPEQDPNYVNIGSVELIDKRSSFTVPIPPQGTLSDYVPFYFTPFSPMMYNIRTGHGGIARREDREIVIFVTSVYRLRELGLPFIYTNQHAYAAGTEFFDGSGDLSQIDWTLLQRRDFKTDDADPGKSARYQAEALIHRHVPLEALLGIGCYDETVKSGLDAAKDERGLSLPVKVTRSLYF